MEAPLTGPTLSADSPPAPVDLLRLLSAGLIEFVENAESRPPRVPYPAAWQRALNQLSAECLERGKSAPKDAVAALNLCRKPFNQWDVKFDWSSGSISDTLLDPDSDEPTELCRELAEGLNGPGAELELNERCMARLRERTEENRRQDQYVFLRKYVIQHAVADARDRMMATFQSELATLGEFLESFYEPVPEYAIVDGHVRLCGHCGWTLIERYGHLHCGDPRCRLLTRDFSRTRIMAVPAGRTLQRVRRSIRRYVVAPGVHELRLLQKLTSLGVGVELWPGFDQYDIRITFPSEHDSLGEAWGVDLKDWRFPRLLAPRLTLPGRDGAPAWDRFFYVIPDERDRENPAYLRTLREMSGDRGFQVLRIKDLLQGVRARVRQNSRLHDDLA